MMRTGSCDKLCRLVGTFEGAHFAEAMSPKCSVLKPRVLRLMLRMPERNDYSSITSQHLLGDKAEYYQNCY